jgi:hypothetical protein
MYSSPLLLQEEQELRRWLSSLVITPMEGNPITGESTPLRV